MNLHLQNKHILITGGSKGIGLACAGAFLQEGANVTLVARNSDTLVAAQQELSLTAPAGCKIHVVSADLTQADAALAALAEAEGFAQPDISATLTRARLASASRPRRACVEENNCI